LSLIVLAKQLLLLITVSGTYPWWNEFFYFDVITDGINVFTMELYDNATKKWIGYAE